MARANTVRKNTVRGIVVIFGILLVFAGTMFMRYRYLEQQYRANAEIIASLEHKKAEEEERTEKLRQQEAYQQTDAYVEETARKLLNLVKPGDTTIKPNEQE